MSPRLPSAALITVGNPTTYRISGQIKEGGAPLENVRVHVSTTLRMWNAELGTRNSELERSGSRWLRGWNAAARQVSMRQIITVVVLVLTLGLHWVLLQSAAWVSMIVRFAQHNTLTLAVSKTLDGHHPCSLCVFVADGKKTEQQQQQQTQLTVQKLEIFCETAGAFVFQETPPNLVEPRDQEGLARFERPPLPPPRFV